MDLYYISIENLNKNKKLAHSLQHDLGCKIVEYAAKNIYDIKNPEIEVVNSKPQFKYSKKQFSISHSNNIVIAGFDDSPIGVDIEYIKSRDFISIAERMSFNMEEDSLDEFYKLWTQYEAKYKLGFDTKYCLSQNKQLLSGYCMLI